MRSDFSLNVFILFQPLFVRSNGMRLSSLVRFTINGEELSLSRPVLLRCIPSPTSYCREGALLLGANRIIIIEKQGCGKFVAAQQVYILPQ